MKKRATIASIALTGLALSAILTQPVSAGSDALTLTNTILKMTIPSRPAAGYFTLTNTGETPRVLVGATSPACGKAMLHQSKMEDGVMKMLPVDALTIAPGATLEFAPGGYHVMCMKPVAGLKSRPSVPLALKFENGDTLEAAFTVVTK